MRPTLPLPKNPPTMAYLLSRGIRVDAGYRTPCLLWSGAKNGQGYGTLNWNGTTFRVHRLSYMLVKGPILEGLVPDHLCRNRACFDPEHLEPVTHRVNLLRSPDTVAGRHATKTHCKNGHPYDEANTVIINAERGWRDCRACRKAKRARAKAQRKAATP